MQQYKRRSPALRAALKKIVERGGRGCIHHIGQIGQPSSLFGLFFLIVLCERKNHMSAVMFSQNLYFATCIRSWVPFLDRPIATETVVFVSRSESKAVCAAMLRVSTSCGREHPSLSCKKTDIVKRELLGRKRIVGQDS